MSMRGTIHAAVVLAPHSSLLTPRSPCPCFNMYSSSSTRTECRMVVTRRRPSPRTWKSRSSRCSTRRTPRPSSERASLPSTHQIPLSARHSVLFDLAVLSSSSWIRWRHLQCVHVRFLRHTSLDRSFPRSAHLLLRVNASVCTKSCRISHLK